MSEILFISDIHGSAYYMEQALQAIDRHQPKQVVLVGDALYHGPRNPLPEGYAPQQVAMMLNKLHYRILAVRGNCDAEVDQMLLDFPMMGDYVQLQWEKTRFFVTHGHIFSPQQLPTLEPGTVFVSGHTHVPVAERRDGLLFFNPGSIALPKEGFAPSYGLFTGKHLQVRTFQEDVLMQVEV